MVRISIGVSEIIGYEASTADSGLLFLTGTDEPDWSIVSRPFLEAPGPTHSYPHIAVTKY